MGNILVRILKKILGDDYYLIHVHNIQSLDGWFHSSLNKQYELSKIRLAPSGAFYEFGTGGGKNLVKFLLSLKIFCKKNNLNISDYRIFLFDTFEGMPKTNLVEDKQVGWAEGEIAFSIEKLKQIVTDAGINLDDYNIRFIKGNFSNSLTPELRNELKQYPPSIVDIDVDYYSSTKTVLDWLTPICNSGVLFYFDDYWAFHGNPEYGQIKAINEFNEKDLGYLTPFSLLGMPGKSMIFSKKIFEHV
jgi:hypothetical protein